LKEEQGIIDEWIKEQSKIRMKKVDNNCNNNQCFVSFSIDYSNFCMVRISEVFFAQNYDLLGDILKKHSNNIKMCKKSDYGFFGEIALSNNYLKTLIDILGKNICFEINILVIDLIWFLRNMSNHVFSELYDYSLINSLSVIILEDFILQHVSFFQKILGFLSIMVYLSNDIHLHNWISIYENLSSIKVLCSLECDTHRYIYKSGLFCLYSVLIIKLKEVLPPEFCETIIEQVNYSIMHEEETYIGSLQFFSNAYKYFPEYIQHENQIRIINKLFLRDLNNNFVSCIVLFDSFLTFYLCNNANFGIFCEIFEWGSIINVFEFESAIILPFTKAIRRVLSRSSEYPEIFMKHGVLESMLLYSTQDFHSFQSREHCLYSIVKYFENLSVASIAKLGECNIFIVISDLLLSSEPKHIESFIDGILTYIFKVELYFPIEMSSIINHLCQIGLIENLKDIHDLSICPYLVTIIEKLLAKISPPIM